MTVNAADLWEWLQQSNSNSRHDRKLAEERAIIYTNALDHIEKSIDAAAELLCEALCNPVELTEWHARTIAYGLYEEAANQYGTVSLNSVLILNCPDRAEKMLRFTVPFAE